MYMCTHLPTLQISPHGTFSADGHTSAIENAQHKHWECEQHPEYNAQHYCCHRQPEAQNAQLHTDRQLHAIQHTSRGRHLPSIWPGRIHTIILTWTQTSDTENKQASLTHLQKYFDNIRHYNCNDIHYCSKSVVSNFFKKLMLLILILKK